MLFLLEKLDKVYSALQKEQDMKTKWFISFQNETLINENNDDAAALNTFHNRLYVWMNDCLYVAIKRNLELI